MKRNKILVTLFFLMAMLLLQSGCGGGDDDTDTSTGSDDFSTTGATDDSQSEDSSTNDTSGQQTTDDEGTDDNTDSPIDGEIDTLDEAIFAVQISLSESYLAFVRAEARLGGEGEATIRGISGTAVVEVTTFTDNQWEYNVTFNDYSTLYPNVTHDSGKLEYSLDVTQDPPSQSGTMNGNVVYNGTLEGEAVFDILLTAECSTSECQEITYTIDGSVNEFDVNVSFTCNVQTGTCNPA